MAITEEPPKNQVDKKTQLVHSSSPLSTAIPQDGHVHEGAMVAKMQANDIDSHLPKLI